MTPMIERTVRRILANALRDMRRMWTCGLCGAETTILSECCIGCGDEPDEPVKQDGKNAPKVRKGEDMSQTSGVFPQLTKGGKKKGGKRGC
jgi:hypothetical protein